MGKKEIGKWLVIGSMVLVVWIVLAVLFMFGGKPDGSFWCGVGFTFLAFGIFCASLMQIRNKEDRALEEIGSIPAAVTVGYLAVTMIFNIAVILLAPVMGAGLTVVVNLCLIVGFVGLRLFADHNVSRVEGQNERIAGKIQDVKKISMRLAVLISNAEHPQVKKRLKKLKEAVDYSSNMSQAFHVYEQEAMIEELGQIQRMLDQGSDADLILDAINEADKIWKTRNSLTEI